MAQTPSDPRTATGDMRPLGQTGIEVSAVGIGTWAIGSGWGQQSEDESIAALHRALDLGCRLIDTAQAYGNGQSERVIARVFKERGERVPVATKVPPMDLNWETTPGVTRISDKYPARYIVERCEVSLRNLQTDVLDVYQFHTWSPSWNEETEWYETMLKLREQGKIRAIGISVHDMRPDEANGAIAAGHVDSVQLVYNILDQRPRTQVFPLARQHNVGILARVPLASGALSGRWTRETTFPRGDWRASVFTGEELERTLRYVDDLRFLEAAGGSMVEAAIRFSFSDPAVSSTIPGTRNAAQTETILRAWLAGTLPNETLQRLYSLWDTEYSGHIQTSIGGAIEM